MTEDAKNTGVMHEVFDEIRADRACAGCGFNLYGQSVTKEAHYGLAICTCPECGTVAALQSYPVMTHWVNRFRALIAAVWIVVLLALFIGNFMGLMGLGHAASNLASQKMSVILGRASYEWEQAKITQVVDLATANGMIPDADPDANASNTPIPDTIVPVQTVPGIPPGTTVVIRNGVTLVNGTRVYAPGTALSDGQYRWTVLNQEWCQTHLDQTIKDHGGILKNIDPEWMIILIPATILSLLSGIFWSVALLGASRKRAMVVPVAVGVIALGILLASSIPDTSYVYAMNLMKDSYAWVIGPVLVAWCVVVMGFGIWSGRKIARWVVRTALPPRSRVPLGLLWARDGLSMPKT